MNLTLKDAITKLEKTEQIKVDRDSIELGTLGISLIAEYNHKPGKFIVHIQRKDFFPDYKYFFPAEGIEGIISANNP